MTQAGYYDQSYPPSVWAPPATPQIDIVELSGWDDLGAIVGTAVAIEVHVHGSEEVVAPTTVDWGDGTTNALTTHTYAAAAATITITVHATVPLGAAVGTKVTRVRTAPLDEPSPAAADPYLLTGDQLADDGDLGGDAA